MNNSENAPGKTKSKAQTQTSEDNTRGPEVVEQAAATDMALSVKDQPLADQPAANQRQKSDLKKRKQSWLSIPWEFLILLSPLTMLIILLATDPTAIHLLQAEFGDPGASTVEQYTKALNIRKDPEVLARRAWAEFETDKSAEFSDLETASRLGAHSGPISWEMAIARANTNGIDTRTLDLLRDSAKQSIKHFKAFPVDFTEEATTFSRSICGLIACGELKDAENFLKTPPHTFYGRGEKKFFGALLKREAGDYGGATYDLSSCNREMHSDFYNDPACFQVLMALDAHNGKSASEWLDYLTSYHRTFDWLVDYVTAWTAFEHGDLKTAHQMTTKVETFFADNQPAILGLNGLAACHLLEANMFAKQGQRKQATAEFAKYIEFKNKGFTGKLLIPKPYREWIDATRPNGLLKE